MALAAFVSSTAKASPLPRWLGITMMAGGIWIEFAKGTLTAGTTSGILSILPVMSLVILAPLLSTPLRAGGYFEAVAMLLRNLLDQPKKLYAGISASLFLLSPILSLGSVRIIHEFLDELRLPPSLTARSYVAGFSTAVLWSPYFASVSLVLAAQGIPFKTYILYGIGMSLLSLVIGNVLFALSPCRLPASPDTASKAPLDRANRMKLVKLVLSVVVLLSVCLVTETVTHWSMTVIVCLVSIAAPLLWAAATSKWRAFAASFKDYRDRTVPMMNNEILLFLSAGLLGYATQGTGFADRLTVLLTGLAQRSFFLFAVALMGIALAITYAGVHQIAAVGALAMQLNAQALGISSLGLAMFLLLTWSLSTALSPFSGLNIMVARFTGRSGVEIGLKANGLHLAVFAALGLVLIFFITRIT